MGLLTKKMACTYYVRFTHTDGNQVNHTLLLCWEGPRIPGAQAEKYETFLDGQFVRAQAIQSGERVRLGFTAVSPLEGIIIPTWVMWRLDYHRPPRPGGFLAHLFCAEPGSRNLTDWPYPDPEELELRCMELDATKQNEWPSVVESYAWEQYQQEQASLVRRRLITEHLLQLTMLSDDAARVAEAIDRHIPEDLHKPFVVAMRWLEDAEALAAFAAPARQYGKDELQAVADVGQWAYSEFGPCAFDADKALSLARSSIHRHSAKATRALKSLCQWCIEQLDLVPEEALPLAEARLGKDIQGNLAVWEEAAEWAFTDGPHRGDARAAMAFGDDAVRKLGRYRFQVYSDAFTWASEAEGLNLGREAAMDFAQAAAGCLSSNQLSEFIEAHDLGQLAEEERRSDPVAMLHLWRQQT